MDIAVAEKVNVIELLKKKPVIISGPCSAETEEQVLATAVQLKQIGRIDMLRAGIWKPRTRPGSFEGVGVVGLPWLQKAKKITGLPTAVEVATGRQVEEALKHQVDVLWLGARTTVNPFSVQEVADALRGVKLPVLIKNPINPDLDLWGGAVERVAKAGIPFIGLVHRGFSVYGHTQYRNAPLWHLAIDMKLRHPELIILNDPSHICGNREMLLEVSQKAIDLDYDGLMIESHVDPDNAWSDALQQVTPGQLLTLLQAITWRSEDALAPEAIDMLEKLRSQIDHLDDELLLLMCRRMKLADEIGAYKRDNNITILQAKRWSEILERALSKAEALGLSNEFISRYFDAIHMESISHQEKVYKQ